MTVRGPRHRVAARKIGRAAHRVVTRWRRRRAAKSRGRSMRSKVLTTTLLVILGTFGWSLRYLAPHPTGVRLTFDQLSALAEQRRIVEATFQDEDALVVGTFSCAPSRSSSLAHSPVCTPTVRTIQSYWLPYPKSDLATGTLLKLATEAGARVGVNPQVKKAQTRLVTTFLLPLMILANLFALLFSMGRGGSSGIGEVIVFGSIRKGRLSRRRKAPVTFADVAGADEAVTELREVVDYLKNPERYLEIGAMPPRGVLMMGPPGCGKTLLAKAAAGEAAVPFFSVAGAEFVESLVGVGAARVRDLFQRVRAVAPAIVFIDELDAAGRRRGAGGGTGGSDEREQTLNQLLVEMDGFDAGAGIVVVGATNRADILDPALLRPGRFDRHVVVDQPDREGRRAILALHARERRLAANADLDLLARRTPGFSGADLANVINEGALLAVRAGKTEIEMSELLEAVERVLAGPRRRGRVLTAAERRRVATHEAGHAVVAAATGDGADVHRVTILARGRSRGETAAAPDADAEVRTRSAYQREIVVSLGGLAAEEMALGEPSSGAEGDLQHATRIALDVVARYGMSRRIGRARLLATDANAMLGEDAGLDTVSERMRHEVEDEVRALLDDAEREATRILAANRSALADLVARLETDETIEGPPLVAILNTVTFPETRPPVRRRKETATR